MAKSNPSKASKAKTIKSKTIDTQWEEQTHERIVRKAIDLMKSYSQSGRNRDVKDFFNLFYTNNTTGRMFETGLFQGLKDADLKDPYFDNGYFYRHFYNPKTRKNFKGDPHVTAYSEALKYFKLSEHYGKRIAHFTHMARVPADQFYINAGYYLGLSLHFFTDLTQPMHAANFTNFYGDEGNTMYRPDLRHSGFEIYADDAVKRGLLDDLRPLNDSDLEDFTGGYAGNYIQKIAFISKDVFDKHFKEILDKKFMKLRDFDILAISYWKSTEADGLLEVSTKVAPYFVANYLTNWTLLSKIKLNYASAKWHQILEPTKAPANHTDLPSFEVSDLGAWDEYVQRYKRSEKWSQYVYLMYNADGTVCIGSREGKKRLWYVYESNNHAWIGKAEAILRATRFRLTSYDEGKKTMIFESTKHEVVHVNTDKSGIRQINESPGYYMRWSPAHDDNQWFILQEAGNISAEDLKEIKGHYNDFGDYDWAGDLNVVPEWEKNIPKVTGLDLLSNVKGVKKLTKPKKLIKSKPQLKTAVKNKLKKKI